MSQADRVLYGGLPRLGFEAESGIVVIWSLYHGRELEEVAGNDELDSSEWSVNASHRARDHVELVEESGFDHGDLIDDENLDIHPTLPFELWIFEDVHDKLYSRGFTNPDSSKAMEGGAADAVRCKARRGGDSNAAVAVVQVLYRQAFNDLPQKKRLASTCRTCEEDALSLVQHQIEHGLLLFAEFVSKA